MARNNDRTGGRRRKTPPLYEQVARTLRAEIAARHTAGDKLESGPALARRLGVSVLTVREAVNALTQEGLLTRERGSGTYVRGRVHRPVALLVGLSRAELPRSYFFLRIVHRLEELLNECGLGCRHYYAFPEGGETGAPIRNPMFAEDIARERVSAVVPISLALAPADRERLDAAGVHVVDPGVVTQNFAGMVSDAVGYLLAHGRRRLALLQWPTAGSRDRFEELLRNAGIEPDPRWMVGGLDWRDREAPVRAFGRLWGAGPEHPNGLVCLEDYIFDLATPALLQLGVRVPEDLMIVIHANKGSGMRSPFPVARMEFDPDAYADALANLIRRTVAREPLPPLPILVTHRWIPERAESLPPP